MSSEEPLFLEVDDVLEIHATQLDVYGGGAGLRDQGLLESAVAQPRASFGGDFAHEGLFAMAAAYLFHIVKNHPFVDGNKRTGLLSAKLLGLMMTFDEAADGAATMTLSGPMALFHDTVKYGNALARWFPALVATPGWSLRASIVLSGETLRFDLGADSPLPRAHAMPRAHDSRLAYPTTRRRFARTTQATSVARPRSDWTIARL